MARIIRPSELIIPEPPVPSIAGSRKQPEGSTGAGVLIPPSHQTYFIQESLGDRMELVTPTHHRKLWVRLNKAAERL